MNGLVFSDSNYVKNKVYSDTLLYMLGDTEHYASVPGRACIFEFSTDNVSAIYGSEIIADAKYICRITDKCPTCRCEFYLKCLERPAYMISIAASIGPNEEVRAVVSREPYYAYRYALLIDKGPTRTTLDGVLSSPAWAYTYGTTVLKEINPEIAAAIKGTDWEKGYKNIYESNSIHNRRY